MGQNDVQGVFLWTSQGCVGPSTGLAQSTLGTPSPSPESFLGLQDLPANAPWEGAQTPHREAGRSLLLMVVLNSLTSPFFIICYSVFSAWYGVVTDEKFMFHACFCFYSCSCYWCFLSLIRVSELFFFFLLKWKVLALFKIMYVNCSVVSDFLCDSMNGSLLDSSVHGIL